MIKSVWVEIRPALKSCQICFVFGKKIVHPLNIKITKSEIQIEIFSKWFLIKFKDFEVEPLTVTFFKATTEYLHFRIQADLKINILPIFAPEFHVPSLDKQKFFVCLCGNLLTKEIKFTRILPLPSNEFNSSDLFCHNHNLEEKPSVILPNEKDCFYSDYFISVHEKIVIGCKETGKFLKCQRCLATVGINYNKSVNFWLICLNFPDFKYGALEQLKYFVKKIICNTFTIFPKILLECEENNTYLSIAVIDKNLIIATCQHDLDLKSDQVVKLKFRFYCAPYSQLKTLENDPFHCTNHFKVQKFFLDFTFEYLTSISKSIPAIYNKIGDESVAYLKLNECFYVENIKE